MAAKVKISYYSVRRNGRGFWEPRPHMRALGFYCVPCGQDGPDVGGRVPQRTFPDDLACISLEGEHGRALATSNQNPVVLQ